MYRSSICIGVLILMSLPLWSQQDSGDSAPSLGETFQDCDECPKMVVVLSGVFAMGSPKRERKEDYQDDEGPMRRGGSYVDGKQYGQWVYRDSDGIIRSKETYVNGERQE